MSTTVMQEDRVYSIETAAEMLALSPWTLRKWISERKIASCKIGARRLVPASEVSRIIRESLTAREDDIASN